MRRGPSLFPRRGACCTLGWTSVKITTLPYIYVGRAEASGGKVGLASLTKLQHLRGPFGNVCKYKKQLGPQFPYHKRQRNDSAYLRGEPGGLKASDPLSDGKTGRSSQWGGLEWRNRHVSHELGE